MRIISRTVWILSLVSMFTDIASEMLYPVMPVYLKSIHFSVLLIGILEGAAEAAAGLSKGYFGKRSDNLGKRLVFVQWGYFLSALSKPLMAVIVHPLWVFSVRTLDRLGKGIRTGARDAMLSAAATPDTKARVFGFHRSLDTLGAVLGPGLALVYLYYRPYDYNTLFLLAFIPGIFSIGFTVLLKDTTASERKQRGDTSFFGFARYLKTGPKGYKRLVSGLLFFALINSSDVFLLLRIKEVAGSDTFVIGSYIFYNLVYAMLSYPIGIIADRVGIRKTFISGLIVFSLVYLVLGIGNSPTLVVTALVLYGVYAASTEGIAKAWITNLTDRADHGLAIGAYAAFQSICALFASSITGFVWWKFGAVPALLVSSLGALATAGYLALAIGKSSAGTA